MRKVELIHIHALFLEIRHSLNENEETPIGMYSTYDALDVRPTSIHKSKENHYEAISTLGGSIERSLDRGENDGTNPQ